MLIAWTTVAKREQADTLATDLITAHLAACVQIEGPLRSVYRWQGKVETSEEYRLTIKFVESRASALEAYISAHHPYENPEWIVVRAEHVAEKYLSWAVAVSTSSTL
jgi:periplasmic divalent cation tolerance protein